MWELYEKKMANLEPNKRYCKVCNRPIYIASISKRKICRGCGHWVYLDPKEEFKDKLRGRMKK